jgi:P-type Cu+ transporter
VGCFAAFELLADNGLDEFYALSRSSGMQLQPPRGPQDYSYLDGPETRKRFIDFADEQITRVSFTIPTIHCVACIWLLENLSRLNPAILEARANFSTRQLRVQFASEGITLSGLVSLLTSIGYEPELKLEQLEATKRPSTDRRLWLQLGVAGFAFGNTMLFSLADYLGLDEFQGHALHAIFGWLSLLLAIPLLVFSAADYWRSAWVGIQQRRLTIEAPIALGLTALFAQSTYEIISETGGGFFDSLAGLIFFLLIGRVFQRKTYDRLSFERDYKSFFPLAASRIRNGSEERVALSDIHEGDRLVIRHGELIPADGELREGQAFVDYSFVTGEAEPVARQEGDGIFAGGRQLGAAIQVETLKTVSQSYLTSLWNQDAFRDDRMDDFQSITNRFSPWFTSAVVLIAIAAGLYWLSLEPARSVRAFTAVLIVACPCALALAAPFALGTAQRILGASKMYLKNPGILERLAMVDTVVFDKTGTLTHDGIGEIEFVGPELSRIEKHHVRSLAEQSTHPYANQIASSFNDDHSIERVTDFEESVGRGLSAQVGANQIRIGSIDWLAAIGVNVPDANRAAAVHVVIDDIYRGAFYIRNSVREQISKLIRDLRGNVEVALLSGDNDREAESFRELFGPDAVLRFNQSPQDKLDFIHSRQKSGRTVLMAGDGLNDAGALKQSDVGVAVVENTNRFSPASDLILDATQIARLNDLLAYSKRAVNVVRFCLFVSVLYNVVGLSFAARGVLSPVVCAILMPLSSISVVALASALAAWLGRGFARTRIVPSQSAQSRQSSDSLHPLNLTAAAITGRAA